MKNKFYMFIICIILLISISLKVIFYLQQAPFIGDEANVILPLIKNNIENVMFSFRNPGELAAPLWCFLQKFIANIAGINELSMRFLQLLFGIVNLFVFIKFSKEFLNKKASIIVALFLFAINLSQVRFSSMVKPYIIDVTVLMLFLIYLSKTVNNDSINKYTLKQWIFQFFSFCTAYLLSLPAIFIGPTVLFLLILNELSERTKHFKRNLTNLLLVFCANCIALGCYYAFFLSGFRQQKQLNNEWLYGYGFFPNTKAEFAQLADLLFDRVQYWDKTNDAVLYSILILIFAGIVSYLISVIKKNEKLSQFAILITPVIVMLFAGAIHIYPFANRLVLFLLPIFIVLIAKTCDYISKKTWYISIPFVILTLVYLINSSIFPIYKEILTKKEFNWSCFEFKEMYKDLREIPEDTPIIIGDCLFLNTYVYNHIYNFKPKKIIYTYWYSKILEVVDLDQHIIKIKDEPVIYALWSPISERDNIDKFKKDLLDEHYNVELIKKNTHPERGLVILEKYTKK